MGDKKISLSASIKVGRKPKDGNDAVTYEIRLDTDSVVLDSATKQFVTHNLGDVHFIYHQGSYTEDITNRIINTYSYIILYYGYDPKIGEDGKPELGSDGKPVMEYKVITYSANEGVTDIYNTMQMNVGDDAECYGAKYIWYDKNLPDNDDAMFKKIWSELDGVPPTELGIKILATKMFTVRREADSVQSSDVMFGISDSNTQAPTTWITNFSDLTLADGKYVWTCTKTTLTNGTSYYTGAYCLGDCYDFAQVEELYALNDSSTNPPKDAVFSSLYKVVKGKYLWSCVKVTYSDTNIRYINKKCVNYFPNDGTNGTKFTPKGTAYAHYSKASELPTPSIATVNRRYLVDVDDKSTPAKNTPCVCYYKNTTTFMSDVAAEGDAYNIGGTLWVHDGKVWHDFGSVQGPKGDDGEDALNIELSVEKILFSYYEGNFEQQNKTITLIVRQGGNVIKSSEYNVKILAAQNFDISTGNKLTITKQDNYCTLNCFSSGVTLYNYTYDDGASYVSYPASSCSIKISVEYNGITYFKEISIEVSFVKMYGGLAYDTESLSSTYGELVGDNGRLKQMETQIYQNAKNITLTAKRTDGLETQYSEIKVQYDNISLKVSNTEKGLRDTGIDITNGSITMTANNFTLYNNKGEETFSADENGNGIFKGKITATSGYIGGCEIYDDSYEIEGTSFNYKGLRYQIDADGYMPQHVVNMRDRGFYVGYGDSAMGGYFRVGKTDIMVVSSGGKKELSYGYFFEVSMTTTASVTGQSAYAAKLKAASNASGKATALEANAYGGKENYAVDAINGDIRVQNGDFRAENGDFIAEKGAFIGVHRGNVTKISDDYTLKKTDSTIICINKNKGITINLPKPSEVYPGTFYRIIKRGNAVTLKSYTSNISFVSYGDVVSSVTSGKAREWINCFCDGEYWYVEMSGN